jgi:hypothetical protein
MGGLRGMLVLASISAACEFARAEDTAWVSMPNGKNLDGWTSYFEKSGLTNPDSTFRYSPEGHFFVDQHVAKNVTGFGHLFYTKKKLSYYMVRAVYRFTTKDAAPGFAPGGDQPQNNGLMIHSQDPKTMNGKAFPTSSECQLLGPENALNSGPKSQGFLSGISANLCVSGITVNYKGNDISSNCWKAEYPAAWKNTKIPFEDADGWSDITVRVLGDSLIQHFIHGQKVLEFSRIRANGSALKDGYLAIQAEGTPTQFKTLEYVELTGCMDKGKPGYRTYFVKSDPALCDVTGVGGPFRKHLRGEDREGGAPVLVREGRTFAVRGGGASILEVRRPDGSRVDLADDARAFAPDRAGVYLVTLRTAAGTAVRRAVLY